MASIRCPICGGKVRITRYKLGGGRVDCFRCRTTWIGSRTDNGYGIYGIRFRHPKRPHSGTQRYNLSKKNLWGDIDGIS